MKLKYLPQGNARRRHLAARYTKMLSAVEGVKTPTTPEHCVGVWHLYIIQLPDFATREAFSVHSSGVHVASEMFSPLRVGGRVWSFNAQASFF